MTDRRCLDCGVPESTRRGTTGRHETNIDPATGYCTKCMVRRALGRPLPRRLANQHRTKRSAGPSVCQCGPAAVRINKPYELDGVTFMDSYCGVCGRTWPRAAECAPPTEVAS